MLRALELLGNLERQRFNSLPPQEAQAKEEQKAEMVVKSPYFTPPRSRVKPGVKTGLPFTPSSSPDSSPSRTPVLPPTPTPLRKKAKKGEAPVKPRGKRRSAVPLGHDPLTTDDTLNAVLIPPENGPNDRIGKIHLIQERVRHDPWKMLVATCLLNVTTGRAAIPIYIEMMRRWPTPQAMAEASVLDLTELLYPIGLHNQRASSLVRFSQQYLNLDWPIHPGTQSSDPFQHPTTSVGIQGSIPIDLNVLVFHGAGRYASDSFRIYSDWLPGGGGPEKEERWMEKRQRAMERMREEGCGGGMKEDIGVVRQGWDADELGEYLSDEDEAGEEEWRRVRPLDKELRRYLIWRWGLEGIRYDIKTGPHVTRERDQRRLGYLL